MSLLSSGAEHIRGQATSFLTALNDSTSEINPVTPNRWWDDMTSYILQLLMSHYVLRFRYLKMVSRSLRIKRKTRKILKTCSWNKTQTNKSHLIFLGSNYYKNLFFTQSSKYILDEVSHSQGHILFHYSKYQLVKLILEFQLLLNHLPSRHTITNSFKNIENYIPLPLLQSQIPKWFSFYTILSGHTWLHVFSWLGPQLIFLQEIS